MTETMKPQRTLIISRRKWRGVHRANCGTFQKNRKYTRFSNIHELHLLTFISLFVSTCKRNCISRSSLCVDSIPSPQTNFVYIYCFLIWMTKSNAKYRYRGMRSERPKSRTHQSWINLRIVQAIMNKKVLLRERKRHTARRVASTLYAALSNGRGVTPSSPGQGVPHPVMVVGGTPSS